MDEREWVYWMLLAHGENRDLRKRFRKQRPSDPGAFLRDQPEWAQMEPLLTREALVLHQFLEQGGQFLTCYHPEYPARLHDASAPPLVLYALGKLALLESVPLAAIAGSRNPSEEAQTQTQRVALQLVEEGYGIITGFAKGIDQIAARTALESGGTVVGILPQGLLSKLTQQLAREWMQPLNDDRLLLLSELHPQAGWSSGAAMMRNRLVAALAEFVVIIESGARESLKNGKKVFSGTYHCAEVAHKMGRTVYALDLPAPGNQQLLEAGIARRWGEPLTPSEPFQPSLFP